MEKGLTPPPFPSADLFPKNVSLMAPLNVRAYAAIIKNSPLIQQNVLGWPKTDSLYTHLEQEEVPKNTRSMFINKTVVSLFTARWLGYYLCSGFLKKFLLH